MATYYWIGGNGNWNATSTTNWASTSGGAGGAGVPGTGDDVVFDANSDAGSPFTVTITGTSAAPAVCRDFDANTGSALDQTMTLSMGSTAQLDCYGSLTLPATNFTWSGTAPSSTSLSQLNFLATTTGKTVTTNGVSVPNTRVRFVGIGGGWTLGSALTVSGANTTLDILNGTFDTANFNLSSGRFNGSSTGTRSITFGSSIVTLSSSVSTVFDFSNTTNLTFNANTSQIEMTATSSSFQGGGLTYYNVSYTNTGISTPFISGANTFNNLTFNSRNSSGIGSVSIADNQTITGTLDIQSATTDPTRRIRFISNTPGTQRTITTAAVSLGSGIDFSDIVAAGASAPWDVSAKYGGDCKNNSNITFPAAKTVYRIGTGNFSATQWASTSGGSPAADQFPLAQDTMVFDANTTTGTHTINANYQLGTLDMTDSTTVTLAFGNTTPTFYGDITLSNAVTISGTGAMTFAGRNTQTITSSGRTFTQQLTIDSPGGTVALADNLETNRNISAAFRLYNGTLDLNNLTLTAFGFDSQFGNTRSIAFGTSGKISLNGFDTGSANILRMDNGTGFSFTGTSNFELTYSGSTGNRRIGLPTSTSGGTESNALNVTVLNGSDIIVLNGTNPGLRSTIRSLTFGPNFSGTYNGPSWVDIFGNLTLSSNMTILATSGTCFFPATSGTQQTTTNGVTLDCPITKSGAGTLQLQDNLTMGSTRTFTHTAGTVDLNGKTLTVGTGYSTSNSNVREIAFNGGTLDCTGNFTATTGTNLTTSGTGTISMTSASAKTFSGGGASYPTLNQGGAGTLTITGANTFADITNTNPTASQVTFPASVITKVKSFTLSGTAGNLVSLRSSVSGTQFTLTYEP